MIIREELLKLEEKAHQLRMDTVDTVVYAGGGHIGGSLSAMDIFTILYYKFMNVDPSNPELQTRDRFILSKGHVGVGHVSVLADKGYFDKELLKTFNKYQSKFGMHLDSKKVPGVDVSTGSLGHGLSIAVGMGLGAKLANEDYKIYCVLGDGECNEGSVWEAAMSISHYNLNNVITIVDRNTLMMDGNTEDVMGLEPFTDKWEAFGLEVKVCNGHDYNELNEAFEYALTSEKPVVIIANTIKGNGVDFMASDYTWHYGSIDPTKQTDAKASLEEYYQKKVSEL